MKEVKSSDDDDRANSDDMKARRPLVDRKLVINPLFFLVIIFYALSR